MRRALRLRADCLGELTTDELSLVVGGEIPTVDRCDQLLTGMYPTLPVRGCVKELLQK